jgi:4'-phosphopantetheinyl transferase EntD
VIEALFPAGVIAVCATAEMARDALHAEERACAARMGEKRRREFTLGRACARRALAELGIEDFPLLRGERREPVWPQGVVGSLTHCRGFCAAAVARRDAIAGLGLDAETARTPSRRFTERITTPRERGWLAALPPSPAVDWGVVLFSAKESFYKCYFPLARTFLGFRDAEVRLEPGAGSFTVHLCRDDAPPALGARTFQGRYQTDRNRVITAVTLPTPPR